MGIRTRKGREPAPLGGRKERDVEYEVSKSEAELREQLTDQQALAILISAGELVTALESE